MTAIEGVSKELGGGMIPLTLVVDMELELRRNYHVEQRLGEICMDALFETYGSRQKLSDWELYERHGKSLPFSSTLGESGVMQRETLYLKRKNGFFPPGTKRTFHFLPLRIRGAFSWIFLGEEKENLNSP